MDKINEYRIKINEIDKKIMELLDYRFYYTNKIMNLKEANNIDKFDPTREKIILTKASWYGVQVHSVYREILKISKGFSGSE